MCHYTVKNSTKYRFYKDKDNEHVFEKLSWRVCVKQWCNLVKNRILNVLSNEKISTIIFAFIYLYPAVKSMSTAAHHNNCCGKQDKC